MAGAAFDKTECGKGSARRKAVPLLLFFVSLAALVFLACVPLAPCLAVRKADAPFSRRLLLPMAEGEAFGLRFTHSLNLSDVTDTIECANGRLICRETLFSTYGAGIPDLPDGIGTTLVQTEEGYLLGGIDKTETEMRVMLQTVPDHRLLYRAETIRLLPLFGSGALLELTYMRVPLIALWLFG